MQEYSTGIFVGPISRALAPIPPPIQKAPKGGPQNPSTELTSSVGLYCQGSLLRVQLSGWPPVPVAPGA